MPNPVSLDDAAERVRAHWAEQRAAGRIKVRSEEKYVRELDTFVRYAQACRVKAVAGVTSRLCSSWVAAPVSAISPGSRGRAGQPAASSTRRNRLVVLRQVLKVWADAGWIEQGLLAGVVIAKDPPLPPCPVTPDEAKRLRMAGRFSPVDTLLPALVELALAGLSNTEIAHLSVAAVDVNACSVAVAGRGQVTTRIVPLGSSACLAVEQHVTALARAFKKTGTAFDPDVVPLALHPTPRSVRTTVRPTAVGQHLYRALKVAGVRRTGVTPGSLQEYAANCCYALTNRVEDVAALLGLISLDAAMRYIDPSWQAEHGHAVREQGQR